MPVVVGKLVDSTVATDGDYTVFAGSVTEITVLAAKG